MKFGSREIADVYFKARANMKIGDQHFIKGQPVLHLDTCTATNLESASTTVYAQGGKGNARLIAWDGERTLTFTVTDALMSPIGFAILSGAGVVRKATADNNTNIFVHTVFKAPIEDDGRVRIDLETAGDAHDVIVSPDAPVFGTVLDDADAGIEFCTIQEENIKLLSHCGDSPEGQFDTPFGAENGSCGTVKDNCKHQYSITEALDLVLDFGETIGRKYAGRTMMVDCYTVRRSGAMEMLVDAEHFGGNFYVEASTLFRDQATGEDLAAEFIIPNAKIQSNFTFAMSASGDPSSFDFVMDAFPAYTKFDKTHKCLCALQVIGGDQDAAVEKATECTPVEHPTNTVIEKVYGGYVAADDDAATVWPSTVTINEVEVDDTEAEFARFGRNLSAAQNGLDVDFYGTLVSGYEPEYIDEEDRTGYYFPIAVKLNADADPAPVLSIVDEYGVAHQVGFKLQNGTYNLGIIPVDQDNPVITVAVTWTETGKAAVTTYYAFDFSNVHFA